MIRARFAASFLLLATLGAPSIARADKAEIEQAREAFVRGSELAKDAQWGAALTSFERSAKLRPHAWTTYNIAVSGMTTSGTVIASVNAGAVQDAALNPSTASTSTV